MILDAGFSMTRLRDIRCSILDDILTVRYMQIIIEYRISSIEKSETKPKG